jgi:hypothetical protein
MDSSLRVPTFQSGGAEMHGLIFAELKKYAETKPGMGSWHVLLKNAGLETKTYLSVREYPDAEVAALVAAASSMSGLPVAEVLEDFGGVHSTRPGEDVRTPAPARMGCDRSLCASSCAILNRLI